MARFTRGWLKLHRNLSEKDIADNPMLLSVWIYLLLIANYKESQIIWQGKQRILQPGQCLIKMRELSDKWKCSPTTIWKWFHYLRNSERIEIEARTHGTVVTICNWEQYQSFEDDERTPSEHGVNTERTRREHGVDYSKEVKKRRKKERKNIQVDYPPAYISLWDAYGKIGDKKKGFEAFQKLNLTPEEIGLLFGAIKNYYQRKEEWRSPQHFVTFLNSDWHQYHDSKPTNNNLSNVFDFLPHNQLEQSK